MEPKTILREPPYLGQMGTEIDSEVIVQVSDRRATHRYQKSFFRTNRQTDIQRKWFGLRKLVKRTRGAARLQGHCGMFFISLMRGIFKG